MKTLYLLRHAKSSWSQPDLADFERPLNERGNTTAPFMGELMAVKGYKPSIIISSPALRARQTAELMMSSSHSNVEIFFDDRIYEASPQALRQVVSEADDRCDPLMIVGHNPGLEGFIHYLTGSSEPMPTAALAVITLDISDWRSLTNACGNVSAVYRPKEELRNSAPGFNRSSERE